MAQDIEISTIQRAYTLWAPIYDGFYRRMLRSSQAAASAAAVAAGSKILEIGVGTGLSLADYPPHCDVFGADLSEPMLARAQEKVKSQRLTAVKGLVAMDACRLGLPDHTFDAVVGAYVITLVPDPEGALDEFARVLRPGGEIILVSHLGAEGGLMAAFEKAVAPLAQRIGWRAEFPLQRIRNWGINAGFEVVETREFGLLDYFTLVRLADRRAVAANAA